MRRSDLEALEARVMEETVRRRQLGGYSTEASAILMLCEVMLRLLQHLAEQMPAEKTKK